MNTPISQLQPRPPIAVVLGHVDHGKSTLLDFIRKTNTVEREAGGITQHVAAYEVEHRYEGKPKRITFIDTPGHAAFQAVRQRGASVADIAILVVAADDGVKAQTLEALRSIREASIPFIVAFNKIDKPGADIARAQRSLLESGVYLEKLGGDVPWAAVSAKTGAGVPELLDLVLLVAELSAFTGNPQKTANGYVLEAHLDARRGIAATLIIRDGTLEKGMTVVAGGALSPVRIMENSSGSPVKAAGPSTPVSLVGFDSLPEAGAAFLSFRSKREAESARGGSAQIRERQGAVQPGAPEKYLLPVVIRADALGSMEAIEQEARGVGDERRGIGIVRSGVGDISESDIKASIAAGAPVALGFNVKLDRLAEALARQRGVRFESFSVIYKLTERLGELLKEHGPKRTKETTLGRAKILKVFSSRKDEHLIGARVSEGMMKSKTAIRLMRRKETAGRGELLSMHAARKSVGEIGEGVEFGAQVVLSEAPREGDILECLRTEEY